MSTNDEKIEAQKRVWQRANLNGVERHLIGQVELEHLLKSDEHRRLGDAHTAMLCDMVLGEDAKDRSDEALIVAVRNLIKPQCNKKSSVTFRTITGQPLLKPDSK